MEPLFPSGSRLGQPERAALGIGGLTLTLSITYYNLSLL
jgi:hypothetical protein